MEELEREVELDCDPERAWLAVSEESEMKSWLGGEVEADLRPGGALRVEDESGDVREGFFESVEPGRGFSFWWSRVGEETSRVELELLPSDGAETCVVRVTEARPLANLETELAEIASAEPGPGPVAAGSFCL